MLTVQQNVQSTIEAVARNDLFSDAKLLLLQEVKEAQAFFDVCASADETARSQHLIDKGQLLVGSCKKIYEASLCIVADDAALVSEEVSSIALTLCDVLQMFSNDQTFCRALHWLLQSLEKLRAVTPQLLDNVLICCICLVQDTPVLLEECSSPKDLMFSKAYIQVRCLFL